MIYMDHSATTPVDPLVAEVMQKTLLENWGNPSSRYQKGNEAKIVLETAREQVAGLMNADPQDLFFTSGGTEADNLALIGIMNKALSDGRGKHLITTKFEHSAVLKAAEYLEGIGCEVTYLHVGSEGIIDLNELKNAIKTGTVLVSIMHINNEIGTVQPIEEIGEICRERNIYFHTDAVQSYGKIPIDVKTMFLDLVSVSSHKIYGPKGIGALYIRPGVDIEPRAIGGGQEKNIRTGTENMPGIAGFGEAARICSERIETEQSDCARLRDVLLENIRENVKGDVVVNGNLENRLGANLNMAFPGVEGESLLLALDLDGIAASSGSACSSGSTNPSHVLLALGMDEQLAQSSIRLTLGRSTTEDDVQFVADRLGHHVNRLREFAF